MADNLMALPLGKIQLDPGQPRSIPFDGEIPPFESVKDLGDTSPWLSIYSLSGSILSVGLQVPISVYREGGKYVVFDGHRRWLAHQVLVNSGHDKFNKILCHIRDKPSSQEYELIERMYVNFQRRDFDVFDSARSMKDLFSYIKGEGISIAAKTDEGYQVVDLEPDSPDKEIWQVIEGMMDISSSRRYQIMAALKLPDSVQEAANEKGVPESRLRYVIPIDSEEIQLRVVDEVLADPISNAEIKRRIDEILHGAEGKGSPVPKPMAILSAMNHLERVCDAMAKPKNALAQIAGKDPRTVQSYRELAGKMGLLADKFSALKATIDEVSSQE